MFRGLIRKITYLMGLLLILSAHSRFIDPAIWWAPAFLGLSFSILLWVNVMLLLYWIFRWNAMVFITLCSFLLSYPTLGRHFQMTLDQSAPPGTEDELVRIMSYNVRVFDLYNWSDNIDSRDRMISLMEEKDPAILCLQEYFHSDREGYFATRDTLKNVLQLPFSHIEYTTTLRETDHWGIATFSRYPVVGQGKVELPKAWNNSCIYTDIAVHSDTLRIYNVHLASVGLQEKDYKLLDDINSKGDNEEIERTKGIMNRLKNAFIKRSEQVHAVKAHMESSPYPVILCGDLNDTPASYAYRVIKRNLQDAFVEKGNGFGITYTRFIPAYRIDYIMHSPGVRAVRFRTIRKDYSDHYPLLLEFFIP